MDIRINKLKEQIIDSHLSDFQFKLDEVISMGESPIEKLMILQLFNYFQNYGFDKNNDYSSFYNLKFIEEEICLWDFEKPTSYFEKEKLEEKVKKFDYRLKDGLYNKYIGFKCTINHSEGITIKGNDNSIIFRDVEIRPQYYQLDVNNYYRIDIAFILKRRDWYNNNEVIEERKIAIECDGYDHHSSPVQKREDDIRIRK